MRQLGQTAGAQVYLCLKIGWEKLNPLLSPPPWVGVCVCVCLGQGGFEKAPWNLPQHTVRKPLIGSSGSYFTYEEQECYLSKVTQVVWSRAKNRARYPASHWTWAPSPLQTCFPILGCFSLSFLTLLVNTGLTTALARSSAPAHPQAGPFHSGWPFPELQENTVPSSQGARLR